MCLWGYNAHSHSFTLTHIPVFPFTLSVTCVSDDCDLEWEHPDMSESLQCVCWTETLFMPLCFCLQTDSEWQSNYDVTGDVIIKLALIHSTS